jgi:hypothetical protein
MLIITVQRCRLILVQVTLIHRYDIPAYTCPFRALGDCDGQSYTGKGFLKFLRFPLLSWFHRGSPCSYIIFGMNNRPVGGRSSETRSPPPKCTTYKLVNSETHLDRRAVRRRDGCCVVSDLIQNGMLCLSKINKILMPPAFSILPTRRSDKWPDSRAACGFWLAGSVLTVWVILAWWVQVPYTKLTYRSAAMGRTGWNACIARVRVYIQHVRVWSEV